MANEKVWTPEQREVAADILEREESLYWGAETYLRPKHIADNGMDNLMHVLLEKQCELSEAVELLTGSLNNGHGMLADRLEWLQRRDEFLNRNTEAL